MASSTKGDVLGDLARRGLIAQSTDEDLAGLGEHITCYVGFDPTSDSLGVGNLLGLRVLCDFARAGHQAIALIGGATGLIGDPSGKSEERNLLGRDEIDANTAAVRAQIETIAGRAGADLIVVDNREWLADMNLIDFLREVGKQFSVPAMLRRDSVRSRIEDEERTLSFTEFAYMLLQAEDFAQLHARHGCRLQLGGTDQWGNICSGIDLIRRRSGVQAFGITWPLLVRPDGTKFGKTEVGNVWLDAARTSPYAFWQFWFNTPDADVLGLLERFAGLEDGELDELSEMVEAHPERRDAQRRLADEMTTWCHGQEAASSARLAAEVLFAPEIDKVDPQALHAMLDAVEDLERTHAVAGETLVEVLVASGLCGSKRDARRAIGEGGVYVNNRRQNDDRPVRGDDTLDGEVVLVRRGKRNCRVVQLVEH